MIEPKVGFIVYGVHKDGLCDPSGQTFIDERIVEEAKETLTEKGLKLECHDIVVASKKEAKEALGKFKHNDEIDAIVLFTGTWVWSAHMLSALRDFAKTGKAIVIWTHPGSQGWRPVGGLVLSAALKEIGIKYKFVYGSTKTKEDVDKIVSYCTAGALVNKLNMTTAAAFGGRGMGQNCGVADPSQWTKVFGVDIDSRDTTQLIEEAKELSEDEVEEYRQSLGEWFSELPQKDETTSKSIRLYLAMKKILEQEDFDYYTMQSFPGLGDEYSATCLMQSMMLNDRQATSTLSDFNTLMSTILLNEISTEAIYYGDLQHIDKENKEIKIIGDGTIPPSLAEERTTAKRALQSMAYRRKAKQADFRLVLLPRAETERLHGLGGRTESSRWCLHAAKCLSRILFSSRTEKMSAEYRFGLTLL